MLINLLFTSSTNALATLLLNTIPDIITLLTPNVIDFVAVFFKLSINSFTAFDGVLFYKRSFPPKCKMATLKLPTSNIGIT